MKVQTCVALIGLLGTSLFARVGETEQQLLQRFGSPISRGKHVTAAQGRSYELGPTLAFKQDDWRISCDLIDGRCVRISYSKTGEWTAEHFQTVLNANSQGEKWTDLSNATVKRMAREWKRSDGVLSLWPRRGLRPGVGTVWRWWCSAVRSSPAIRKRLRPLLHNGFDRLAGHFTWSGFDREHRRTLAARAAVLAAHLRSGQNFDFAAARYTGNPAQIAALRAATLNGTPHAWLDGLKAVNPEAYHYWLMAVRQMASLDRI